MGTLHTNVRETDEYKYVNNLFKKVELDKRYKVLNNRV